VIKNLLFVGKVIYLLSPESDATPPQEESKNEEKEKKEEEEEEKEEEEQQNADEEREEKEVEGKDEDEKEEEEEDEGDHDDRPPSLLWLIKKLSLMAKREAAFTPKVPLRVRIGRFDFC